MEKVKLSITGNTIIPVCLLFNLCCNLSLVCFFTKMRALVLKINSVSLLWEAAMDQHWAETLMPDNKGWEYDNIQYAET